MAQIVPLNAFGQQTFATALAPAREDGATALSPHTSAKAMLAFARSLGWLISSLHKAQWAGPIGERLNYGQPHHCQRHAERALSRFAVSQGPEFKKLPTQTIFGITSLN